MFGFAGLPAGDFAGRLVANAINPPKAMNRNGIRFTRMIVVSLIWFDSFANISRSGLNQLTESNMRTQMPRPWKYWKPRVQPRILVPIKEKGKDRGT